MARAQQDEQFTPEVRGIRGKRGPTSILTMRLAERIFLCARYGMSNDEIAFVLGFSKKTLVKWIKSSSVFRTRFDQALSHAEEVIVRGLYKRARGMIITETVTRKTTQLGLVGEDGVKSADTLLRIEKTVCERELPPDLKAIEFILINRRPDKWQLNPTERLQVKGWIDFNAIGLERPAIDKFPNRAKAICDAVRKVIGIEVERDVNPRSMSSEGLSIEAFGLDEMTVTEDVQLAVV